MEAADYIIGDHSPVVITIAKMGRQETTTMQVRNWKNYSQELLLHHLSQENWTINAKEVQDYNDEFEQRLMAIVDKLVPFEERKVTGNKVSESPQITLLRRKKKNTLTNARRRNSANLMKNVKTLEEESNGKSRNQGK